MILMFILTMTLNPEVMKRAQVEIDTVVGRNRMPSFEDYEQLPYVVAVCREAIRCHTISLFGKTCICIHCDV